MKNLHMSEKNCTFASQNANHKKKGGNYDSNTQL